MLGRLGDEFAEPGTSRHRVGVGTDLHFAVDAGLRGVPHVRRGGSGPGGADSGEVGDREVGAGSDGDGVRRRVETGDEARLAVGSGLLDAEALALADRVRHRSVVTPKHFAFGVLDETRTHRDLVGQPGLRVTVGDEADVVGVGLVRHGETALGRLGAHFCLRCGGTDREVAVFELVGGEHTEDVGLVLGQVLTAVQFGPAFVVAEHLSIVAGGDGVEAEREGSVEEGGELDALIAAHAGVRGASGGVFGDEVIDDVFLEPFGEVPDVEGDVEHSRHAVGVAGVFDRAAATRSGAQGAGHPGQGKVDADDFVSGIDGACRGYGRIDSAGHGDEYSHDAPCIHRGVAETIPARRACSTTSGRAASSASTSASVVS